MSLSRQSALVLWCLFLSVSYLILLPIAVFHVFNFWKYKDVEFIHRRHPIFVLLLSLSFLVPAFFLAPIDAAVLILGLPPVTITFLDNISVLPIIMLACRFWLLYYDLQFGAYQMRRQWKSQLTKNYKAPCIFRYRKYLGNAPFLASLCLAIWVYLYVSSSCLRLYHSSFSSTYDIVLVCAIVAVEIVIFIVLSIKTHSYHDVIGIRKELVYMARLLLFYSPWIVAVSVSFSSESYEGALFGRFLLIGSFSYCAGLIFLRPLDLYQPRYWKFIPTLRINAKYNEKQRKQVNCSSRCNVSLGLKEILQMEDGFEAFANHLVTELSFENLLFLSKLAVLHEFCNAHHLETGGLGSVPIPRKLLDIMYSAHFGDSKLGKPQREAWYFMQGLFRTFVDKSRHQLNLSYDSRTEMTSLFNQYMDMEEIDSKAFAEFGAGFEKIRRDILHLITSDSFQRFRASKAYSQLCTSAFNTSHNSAHTQ